MISCHQPVLIIVTDCKPVSILMQQIDNHHQSLSEPWLIMFDHYRQVLLYIVVIVAIQCYCYWPLLTLDNYWPWLTSVNHCEPLVSHWLVDLWSGLVGLICGSLLSSACLPWRAVIGMGKWCLVDGKHWLLHGSSANGCTVVEWMIIHVTFRRVHQLNLVDFLEWPWVRN